MEYFLNEQVKLRKCMKYFKLFQLIIKTLWKLKIINATEFLKIESESKYV